ncbi:unnamed protein product [Sympodiomycopsis kandeliae]
MAQLPPTLSPADYADHLVHYTSQLSPNSPESTTAVVSLLGLFPIASSCPLPVYLSLKSDDPSRVVPELRKCKSYLKGEWEEIATGRVKALVHLGRGGECRNRGQVEAEKEELHKAYESYETCLNAFLRHLGTVPQSTSSRPYLPILTQMLLDLRQLALLADQSVVSTTTTTTSRQPHLEATARQLNKAFTVCVADRNTDMEYSRKWATYKIVNLLFRTYFKLKSLPLCRNILRALSAAPLPPFESFPASDRVTFRYYTGLLHFLSQDWSLALTDLNYSWQNCHKKAIKQQFLILEILLPLKLILKGQLPKGNGIWSVHPRLREIYLPFFQSITGSSSSDKGPSLHLFNSTLSNPSYEKYLVKKGLYACIESFRPILLQTIIRKLYLLKEKHTRLSLRDISKTIQFVSSEGDKLTAEEIEWLIAGLIAKGFIKGYISHERQILVLSNVMPFPSIAAVGIGNPL